MQACRNQSFDVVKMLMKDVSKLKIPCFKIISPCLVILVCKIIRLIISGLRYISNLKTFETIIAG